MQKLPETPTSPPLILQFMRHRLRHELMLRPILRQLRVPRRLSVWMLLGCRLLIISRWPPMPGHIGPAQPRVFQLQSPRFASLAAQQSERGHQRDRERNPHTGTHGGEF